MILSNILTLPRPEKMLDEEHFDERPASWKILLPDGRDDCALIVGGRKGEVVALSRSWRRVDCEAGDELYDLVVCADRKAKLRSLVEHLKPDGTLVCVNRRLTGGVLRRGGFSSVRRYAMLPADNPRVIVPLDSHESRERGLRFHRPSSPGAMRKIDLAARLSRFGVTRHLTRSCVTIASRGERPTLLTHLSEQLGRRIDDLTIYTGCEQAHRKLTVLPHYRDGSSDVVIKLADTRAGVRAIQQEIEALDAVKLPCVPRTILCDSWGGYVMSVQNHMATGPGVCGQQMTDEHFKFLVAMAQMHPVLRPVGQTALWRSVADSNAAGLPDSVAQLLHRVMSGDTRRLVMCHRTHGDFAPWNTRVTGGGLSVIDWEDSDAAGMAFTDAIHFIFRQAAKVGPWAGGAQVLERMRQAAMELASRTGLPADHLDLTMALWLLREYHACPVERSQVIEAIDVLSGQLSAAPRGYCASAS